MLIELMPFHARMQYGEQVKLSTTELRKNKEKNKNSAFWNDGNEYPIHLEKKPSLIYCFSIYWCDVTHDGHNVWWNRHHFGQNSIMNMPHLHKNSAFWNDGNEYPIHLEKKPSLIYCFSIYWCDVTHDGHNVWWNRHHFGQNSIMNTPHLQSQN